MKEPEKNIFDYTMSSPLNNLEHQPGELSPTNWNQKRPTPQELNRLLTQLNYEDKSAIQKKMVECNSKQMFTRVLPTAALITGSLYVIRQKFYPIGPKNTKAFFVLFGGGSFAFANICSMLSCAKLAGPMLLSFYAKYNSGGSDARQNSYDALRLANRSSVKSGNIYDSFRSDSQNDGGMPTSEWGNSEASSRPVNAEKRHVQTNKFAYQDEPILMSGTPLSSNWSNNKDENDIYKNKFD